MPAAPYEPAEAPTLYFIGVTTGQSSIMTIFPHWAAYLGLEEARIVGVDFPLDTPSSAYREVVAFIKGDPQSKGALVTTHKIDLLRASRDLFDQLDDDATLLGEVSCISKRDGRLIGHAKDAVTGRLALTAFLPETHWAETGAEALFLGAGGATVALTSSLLAAPDARQPARLTVSDIDAARIQYIREVHARIDHRTAVRYVVVQGASDNDALVNELPPHSLVANGTGLGKDRPGSPLSDAAVFPENGYAWDYNYRGEFVFLEQAARSRRHVTTVDGWVYFILGWTQVIAEVFDVAMPTEGPVFDALATIAAQHRRGPGFVTQA